MKTAKMIPLLLVSFLAAPVFAQSTATEVKRDVNQQQRIENGLKSGQLNTREAAKLEHEETRVDRAQANALKDGKFSVTEKARIEQMQNKVSNDIHADRTNAQTGNPDSTSSKRMQADVQRNVNQEQRIEAGVKNGSLTNHEVAKLERGQARIDAKEAVAGHDGHVSAAEQARVQRTENRQSRRIHRQKHDAQQRG
ncbi:hypothetical protein ACFQAT_20940 [Undibacterium arcticum]|uniref:Uncharacterized protein n=1 Tax=Undibacterium arcticum TaxID=1762892 RepID=A0ABV7F096_9BURK